MTKSPSSQTTKSKGPIRWEAIIPILLIYVLISLYAKFFFDSHLKWSLELAGYHALGTELNIGNLKSSFFKGSIQIQKIQLTNAEKPTHNSIEIGDIRFSVLWDALLRGKVVINEIAVEQISLDTPRKTRGKVKPPEPPKKGPSAADQLKAETLAFIEKQNQNNVLSDITAILAGGDSNAQLDKLKTKILSKEKITSFETDLKSKEAEWKNRISQLPSAKQAQSLQDRAAQIKTKDFKTPQELEKSLKELNEIIQITDQEIKKIQDAERSLKSDLKFTENGLKDIEKQIDQDIKDLQSHFKIPKLDAAEISKSVFMGYLSPYVKKAYTYKDLAEKYLPPKFTSQKENQEKIQVQPRPRQNGVTYEFGRLNSYPLLWIKRIGLSSQSGSSEFVGDVSGEITHITTHPKLIMKPTQLNVSGDFPGLQIFDFGLNLSLDATGTEPLINTSLKIDRYTVPSAPLVDNKDVQISIDKANGQLVATAKVTSLENIEYNLKNTFSDLSISSKAQNKEVNEVLNFVMNDIKKTEVEAWGKGKLPVFPLNIKSDLGHLIAQGFEKKLQSRINEAKAQLKAFVDAEINKQKQAVELQVNQFRSQTESEINKLKSQFETQKKAVQDKINQAKKDTEEKAKAQVNKEKSKLEAEAKKKAEELKKKLGF